jgi:DNA modification methylase
VLDLNRIYNYDCLTGLRSLPDNTIDLVITSPPYDNLRVYNGAIFSWDYLLEVIKELYRTIKIGGVVVWVVNDKTERFSESGSSFKQALAFKKNGFCLYDTMIFAKHNPPPLNHWRYEQEFEFMFVFSKGKVKTFNAIKVPCNLTGKKRAGTRRHDSKAELTDIHTKGNVKAEKIKGNIWCYEVGNNSTKDKEAHIHEAIFPEELAKDHIISWTNEGDLVVDIFLGSGTVAKMAYLNRRKYLGFEISKDYCDLAESRLAKYKIDD